MKRHQGVIFVCSGLLVLTSCVSTAEHQRMREANDDLRRQVADQGRYLRELESERERLKQEVVRLGSNAANADFVRQQKDELSRLLQQLKDRGATGIPGVNVIETPEGVAFQMQGEILFASGQATITSSGRQVLAQLVPALQEHGKMLRIDGHTDSDPIRHSAWKTNLRLSSERAMAVVEFLTEHGIGADKCFVAAYGEHRPAVEGSETAAKQQNRRVEILMLRE